VILHRLEAGLELEARHAHKRRAAVKAVIHDHRHPVDVEEREEGHDLLVFANREAGGRLDEVGDEVAVGEHDALGKPRRPA